MIPAEYRALIRDPSSYINGRFTGVAGKEALPITYPGTGEVVANLAEAGADEVDQAVQAATDSLQAGTWRDLPSSEKKAVFSRICQLTQQHLPELAALETINTGQALTYSLHAQLPRVMSGFRFFAEYLGQATEQAAFEDGANMRFVARDPLGVVGLISSSNAPTALASTKIAAALAFGNSCVVKTSENTPLALARFMQILTAAGVPDGVVNLVNGRGHITGKVLTEHPGVRGISFTGGTATARTIAASASATLKRLDLELGGKSANIIMPSADLDTAVNAAILSIYTNNGQQCFAGSRIVLHRKIADEFISRFVAQARRIRVGCPFDAATHNGPVASKQAYERVLSYLDIARNEGGEVLTGGRVDTDLKQGYYLNPIAVLAPSNDVRICQEEIFGPFASILVVDSLEQAVAVANDSDYGLVSYLWTTDLDEAMSASRKIQAGLINVNSPLLSMDMRFPFGGYKQSAIGREGATGARSFYTEEKTVAIALRTPALPSFD